MAAWYCLIDDKEYGPFSSERIQSLVKKGKLTKDHFVRPSTDTQWTAASDIPGLFPAEAAKAASPGTAPPKTKPPQVPPAAKAKPPIAAKAHKPPAAAALPATAEEAEIPSALPVAAPVAAPVATPVAAPASLPVGTPVAPSSPAVPPKDPSETIAHVRRKSKQQQYLVAGGLVAVLIVLGAVAIFALNRSPDRKPQEDQVAQSKPDQTETAAPTGEIEADPNPETDPSVEKPVGKRAVGSKRPALPSISRWLDASRKQGILRISDSVIRFHVGNAWLDSSASGAPTLTVEITLTNGSSNESLDFRGWTLAEGDSIKDAVILADDKDQRLSPASTSSQAIARRSTSRRLKPKESVTNQLVFEAPAGDYEHLRLYLPYAAIGRTGYMGFKIPRVMIKDRPPGEEEPIAATAKPAVTEPATDDDVSKPKVVITPPKPPKSDDPFSFDVLRNSIEKDVGDGEKPKPDFESVPPPAGTAEQPKTTGGPQPGGEDDG